MSDDNKRDGPYGFIGGIVECPDGNYKITSGDKYIQAIKSQSYAEGRKAERERCHAIASRDVEVVDQVSGIKLMVKPNCSCAKDIAGER